MNFRRFRLTLAAGAAVLLVSGFFGPPRSSRAADDPKANDAQESQTPAPATLEQAKDRAAVMHNVYASTLEVIHHYYFHNSRAIIPARAMEDIFEDIQRQSGVKGRWIAVNTRAMGVDHAPKSEFEKQAAKVLAKGEPEFVRVEDGVYRRATPIPLGGSCIGCHTGFGAAKDDVPRFAGLVIEIPIKK